MPVFIFITFFFLHEKKQVQNQENLNIEIDQPNVIIIVVDDAGYVDFGCMGSEDLDTHKIDILAKDGVYFTDAHLSFYTIKVTFDTSIRVHSIFNSFFIAKIHANPQSYTKKLYTILTRPE